MPSFLPEGGRLPDDAWNARHASILVLLWFHAAVIPAFGLWRGYPALHVLAESCVVPAAATVASMPGRARRVRTGAASLGLLFSSGVLVHLSGGVIEMHFHFFVMVAVVALYQDWLPFLAAIAFVFVHHGLMGVLAPDSVYNHASAQQHPWLWAGIHAFFISAISAVCLVTWRLNESTLASHAAVALDNARLYESERTARAAAEEARDALTVLAAASRVLTSSLELGLILRDFAALVAPDVADYCAVDLVQEDGGFERIAVVADGLAFTQAEVEGNPPRMDLADHQVVLAVTSGTCQLVGRPSAALAEAVSHGDAARRDHVIAASPASAIVAPLIGRSGILGALSMACAPGSERRFDEQDIPFVEELALRAAVAIENARLYGRQRSVAETLQHSLLPERLPDIPGISAAARYLAGADVEVGGDWYDLLTLPRGRLAMTMGDVTGRGERAASLMGQVRNAVRAYARDGRNPQEVMARVNTLLLEGGPEQMATMVYAVLDQETSELHIVNAGHPPPLLLHNDGSATFIEVGRGMPIGASATARYEEAVVSMRPGEAVVLYTDGLVEDRHEPLEVGLERLRATAVSGPPGLEGLCDHVLHHMLADRRAQDDTALLITRLVELGDRLHLHLPADPAVLVPLRAVLRRWLVGVGASEHECFELLVAAVEATSNAIRHARGPLASHFDLDATIADHQVEICVRDLGSWRRQRPTEGGRGLSIMDSFVDDLEILRRESGTEVVLRRRLDAASLEASS
jgi:anti-sigma regulatory factor (Ser/Thr protein kinase)/GAF domain-containing protein